MDYGTITDKDRGYAADINIHGYAANLLFSSNLSPSAQEWVYFGELGLANLTMENTLEYSGFGYSGKETLEESKTGVCAGAGIGYTLSEQFQLNLSLSVAKASYKNSDDDIKRFAVGLVYGF